MTFADQILAVQPTIGGLPLATIIELQQMLIDGHTAVLVSLDAEMQMVQQMQEEAEQIVNAALHKARLQI
ncbi:hypothetical protein [Pseudomonas monteilii]|uniref:hypothetical protein n=1 Tax=Pseudomonas monteilii TaxID=76759 RepID=UPI0036E6726A